MQPATQPMHSPRCEEHVAGLHVLPAHTHACMHACALMMLHSSSSLLSIKANMSDSEGEEEDGDHMVVDLMNVL